MIYLEIPAPDLAVASAFYTGVFGWKVEASDLSEVPYASFEAGDSLQGGLRTDLSVAAVGGVLLYLAVASIPATLKQIEAAGGFVVTPEEPVGGDNGFSAEFRDPAGNLVGLWSASYLERQTRERA